MEDLWEKYKAEREKNLAETKKAHHGKKFDQKMKPYLVLQYLMKHSDENNPRNSKEIIAYLKECGIEAERRSIYKDIEEINVAEIIVREDCSIDDARDMLAEDETDELKLVVYDKNKKGFYVKNRLYDLEDVRILAECVYSTKFIPEGKAKRLLNVVCDLVSENDASKIRHNAFLTDRVKTNNAGILNNISIINNAMSHAIDGEAHTPEKITFKYLKYTITDMSKQVERRKGLRYTVSPFQLLINDGNYYLLAFNDHSNELWTYRVDRMKDVSYTGVPREGEETFKKLDLKTYTKRVFSMFGGTQRLVTIRFTNHLLDAVVDRFGTTDFQYAKVDDTHFSITGYIEISKQFFGWLLGFGNEAKILYPEDTIKELADYLEKVRGMYE